MINVYAAGDPDPSRLPDGCVGFWPLDGSGTDIVGGNSGGGSTQVTNEEWVKGLFGLAFRFYGDDTLRVTRCNGASADPWNLDVSLITMIAWVRPQSYDPAYEAYEAIIMNKENAWEFGLKEGNGALIAALSPCWRWWGTVQIPLHEWTHVAVSYDGVNEAHFIQSQMVESTACGDGGDLAVSPSDFRIGHRERGHGNTAGQTMGHDQFVGDIDEAMVFNRALGEVDLHGIYRGHYRQNHVTGAHNVQASHQLSNNVDGSSISGDKGTYKAVNDRLIGRIESLVGYWALDGDASDSSGNGLDGTVANPEWVCRREFFKKCNIDRP